MKRFALLFILGLSFISSKAQTQNQDSTMLAWRKVPMNEFFIRYSPIDYLRVLEEDFKNRQESNAFTISRSPDNWIREEYIEGLMRLIDKPDSTKSIASDFSSRDKYSSIGREAQNLIHCFRIKRPYPDFLNSFGPPDEWRSKELKEWWKTYKLLKQ